MIGFRWSLLACVLIAVAMLARPATAAESRVALVIGNSSYTAIGALRNPINDAILMSRTLKDLGFDVIERLDADQRRMKNSVKEFGARLRDAGPRAVGLFYYAGHGVQIGGENYLIPVNVDIVDEADADIEAVSANSVLAQMESAGNRLNIVIMDACRNNPFKRSFRAASRGLARMNATRGTLIAYATSPGDVASDGDGANSPYTNALASALLKPGVIIEQVFKDVRNKVIEATNGRQVPWEASSLVGGDFFFRPPTLGAAPEPAPPVAAAPSTPAPSPAPEADAEAAFWASIRNGTDPILFAAYLSQYPNGRYVRSARSKIADLARRPPANGRHEPPPQIASRPPRVEPPPAPPPPASDPVIANGTLSVKPESRQNCGFVRTTGTISVNADSFKLRYRGGAREKVTVSGRVGAGGSISKTVRAFIGGQSIGENSFGQGRITAQFRNGEFSGDITLVGADASATVCRIELRASAGK